MDDKNRELLVKERNRVQDSIEFCINQKKELERNRQTDEALYAKSHTLFNSLIGYWREDKKLQNRIGQMLNEQKELKKRMIVEYDRKERDISKKMQELANREEEIKNKLRRK